MQIGARPAYENERNFSPGFQNVRPCTTGFIGGGGSDVLVVTVINDDSEISYNGWLTVDGYTLFKDALVLDQTAATTIYRVLGVSDDWKVAYVGDKLPKFVIVSNGTNCGQISYVLNGSSYEFIGVPWE